MGLLNCGALSQKKKKVDCDYFNNIWQQGVNGGPLSHVSWAFYFTDCAFRVLNTRKVLTGENSLRKNTFF